MERRNEENFYELETNAYHLERGHIFFSKEKGVVRTVLGSCVSVCLWDAEKEIGGINHYLYPKIQDKSEARPVYGNIAIIALIKMMHEAGCQTEDITAQIVGGAHLESWAKEDDIGEKNVAIAKNILNHYGIKIISEDTGGKLGRKILFDMGSGHLIVMKVHKLRQSDWIQWREENGDDVGES